MHIGDILTKQLSLAEKNPEALKQFYVQQSKEETKKRNFAIKCFQDRVNKDRKQSYQKALPFIVFYQKLYALKEIYDLKWFWVVCTKYSNTYRKERDIKGKPIRNSFSACFFGALK